MVRYSKFVAISVAMLLALSSTVASSREEGVLLLPSDYIYLATQGVLRDSAVLQKMSPKELRHLHQLINDEKTQEDPQSKADAVRGALAISEGNQFWEKENPGQLWDSGKHRDLNGLNRN